jgi:hypothetical protein
MEQYCKHCNEIIIDNFCAHCGQKKYKRIDKKYIWDEIQYTFLHLNKGFLYTAKKILTNPGKTAKEFIEGDRVNHYKPITFLFVLSGIAVLISSKIINVNEMAVALAAERQEEMKPMMSKVLGFFNNYYSIITILFIPFLALASKISLRKWGHNYFEHIIMNTYIYSFYTLISVLVVYPIMFILKSTNPSLVLSVSFYTMYLFPVLLFWFYKVFYPEKSWKTIILKVLLICFLAVVVFYAIILLVVIGYFLILFLTNPEALKNLKKP